MARLPSSGNPHGMVVGRARKCILAAGMEGMEGWLAGHTDGRRKAAPMREKSSPAGSAAGHSSKALASMARRRREAPRGRCHFLNEAKFDALEGTEALDVFPPGHRQWPRGIRTGGLRSRTRDHDGERLGKTGAFRREFRGYWSELREAITRLRELTT